LEIIIHLFKLNVKVSRKHRDLKYLLAIIGHPSNGHRGLLLEDVLFDVFPTAVMKNKIR